MITKIRSLENALTDMLNASDVPTEVKRIILGKLEAQMTNLANQEILREEAQDAESVPTNSMAKSTE